MCVVPLPEKSNGIQRKTQAPALPCTQLQKHPILQGTSTEGGTAQLPSAVCTSGAPRTAPSSPSHAVFYPQPELTRFWMSALLARSRSSITFFSALTASLSSSFCHCGITAVASICKTGQGRVKGTCGHGRRHCIRELQSGLSSPVPPSNKLRCELQHPKNTGLRPLLSLCPTRALAQDLNSPVINPTRVIKTKRPQRRIQRCRKQLGLH